MFCQKCGKELPDGSQFCSECGASIGMITNYAAQSANGTYGENPIRKKSAGKIIKTIVMVGIIGIVVLFFIGILFGTNEIDLVKGGRLQSYDYGKNIGDALDEWFEGDVTWDSYEEEGTTYVTAYGICPYTSDLYDSNQTFYFEIVDDEHFRFIGAYGSDGYEIFSKSTNSYADLYMGLYSLAGVDLHEMALKAAFGDEESLSAFRDED